MKIKITLCLLLWGGCCLAQNHSPLVKTGESGKLEYTLYANRGEQNQVNRIPDFSWAGYKKGGVPLPEVPVVITLEADSGDNRERLQQAIDQVSAMPSGPDGIRGTILLKAGKYDCSGPLNIGVSGVILRGEGQRPAKDGGTQIHATLTTQHNLIVFSGKQPVQTISSFVLDTITVPGMKTGDFNNDGKKDTIDGKVWLKATVTQVAQLEQEGDRILSLHFAADNGEFVSFDSRENTNKPYLKVNYLLTAPVKDSVVTLFPTDDVFVQGGEYATQNFGADKNLVIKNAGAGNRVTREFYMKFRLPSIAGDISLAEVFLWCNNAGNTGDQRDFVSSVSHDGWNELSVTYQNQPFVASQKNRITTDYIPVGSATFDVDNATGYQAGDLISIVRTPNQLWIDDLQMAQYGWTADAYRIGYERRILSVKVNTITVDVPMIQAIESRHGGGEILKLDDSGRLRNGGVEELFLTSHYASDEDENHAWIAVTLNNTEDCWIKNVTARYFGYGCVGLFGANNTTIQDCAMLDPKSITTGSRKYSFYIDKGSFNLFQRCYTRGGRHDYVTGSRVAGPDVFLDSFAEQTYADIGPHHRYATGILFDNIKGGQIRVQNRKDMGSGHGWAGAQTMFWNLESVGSDIKVESPPGAMNWGIGCKGPVRNGDGYWDNWGNHVVPRSLYLKQLEDRLGPAAVKNITTNQQREKDLYDLLQAWKGIGRPLSDNALLADLRINNVTVNDFDPLKTSYLYSLPSETSPVPSITWNCSDSSATVVFKGITTLPGTVEIIVTAPNGITLKKYIIALSPATSTREINSPDLKLYPNPAGSYITIENPPALYGKTWDILSAEGTLVRTGILHSSGNRLSVKDLQPGIYLIRIREQGKGLLFIKQ